MAHRRERLPTPVCYHAAEACRWVQAHLTIRTNDSRSILKGMTFSVSQTLELKNQANYDKSVIDEFVDFFNYQVAILVLGIQYCPFAKEWEFKTYLRGQYDCSSSVNPLYIILSWHWKVDWPSLPVSGAKCHVLGWPKSSFWFFCKLFLTNPTLGSRTG